MSIKPKGKGSKPNPNKSKQTQPNNYKTTKPKLSPAYHSAAAILKSMSQKQGSLQNLIGQHKSSKFFKGIYALAIKTIKNQKVIKHVIDKLDPDSMDHTFNPFLIQVLIGELLFGQKMYHKYRPKNEVKYIIDNENQILSLAKEVKENNSNEEWRPRYFRVNLLKATVETVLEQLNSLGFEQKKYNKNELTFEKFMTLAKSLSEDEFIVDYHFNDIFLVNISNTKKLTSSQIYQDSLIAIQDKSSLLAIEAMELKPGMSIFDACAAPGMKTAAIASRLLNECKLYVSDIKKSRYREMLELLNKFEVKCSRTLLKDFTRIDPSKYSDLDVILLDPSCTGSGMQQRFEYTIGNNGNDNRNEEKEIKRCKSLAGFQLAMLEAAVKFNPKRIVYSTCSKHQIENEDVINRLLESDPNLNYEVIDVMPQWPLRGIGEYDFSKKCLRANIEDTLTSGFFCCVLSRKDSEPKTNEEQSCEVDVQMEHSNDETTKKRKQCDEQEETNEQVDNTPANNDLEDGDSIEEKNNELNTIPNNSDNRKKSNKNKKRRKK